MNAKDLLVPSQRHMLGTLKGLLAMAAADERGDALMQARLVDDMHPLAVQVRFLCNMVGEAVARVAGITFIATEDDPATIDDAIIRIGSTLEQLDEWEKLKFAADGDPIELALPNGMVFDLTMIAYVRDWSVPQFYFHTSMAYAILRKEGLDVGKADFVPHMFQYLRQPAA
jgi:hypothetical protein